MHPDVVLALQKIMDFCHDKWKEADRSNDHTDDIKTGRKIAYNHVLQLARSMLSEQTNT